MYACMSKCPSAEVEEDRLRVPSSPAADGLVDRGLHRVVRLGRGDDPDPRELDARREHLSLP